jgi:hypothetical protein
MEEYHPSIHQALRDAKKKTEFFEKGIKFYFPEELKHVDIEDKDIPESADHRTVMVFDFRSYDSKFKFKKDDTLPKPVVLEVKYDAEHLRLTDRTDDDIVLTIDWGGGPVEKNDVEKIAFPAGGKWRGAHRVLIRTWGDPMVAWGP